MLEATTAPGSRPGTGILEGHRDGRAPRNLGPGTPPGTHPGLTGCLSGGTARRSGVIPTVSYVLNITLEMRSVFRALWPDILDTVLRRLDLRGAVPPLVEIRRLPPWAAVDAALAGRVVRPVAAGPAPGMKVFQRVPQQLPQPWLPAEWVGSAVVGGRVADPPTLVRNVTAGQERRGHRVTAGTPGTDSPMFPYVVDAELGKGRQVPMTRHFAHATDILVRQDAIVVADGVGTWRNTTAATSRIRKAGAFFRACFGSYFRSASHVQAAPLSLSEAAGRSRHRMSRIASSLTENSGQGCLGMVSWKEDPKQALMARPLRRCSVTTSPGRTTCCRPAARHGTPTACPSTRSHARSTASNALAKRVPTPLPATPLPEGAADLAAHVDAVEVRAR